MNLYTAHKQWAKRPSDERFTNLDELIVALQSRRQRSAERFTNTGDVHVATDEEGELHLVDESKARYRFTNWSFSQFCNRVKAPPQFIATLQPDTAARVLNERIQEREPCKLLYIRESGPNTILHAVTGLRYGRVWDEEVARAVQQMVQERPGWHNPKAKDPFTGAVNPGGLYASDRDVFMFVIDGGSVFDEGPRAVLHRGVIVANSEVGDRRLTLMTFLFNEVCGNHIIYGAENVDVLNIRHDACAPERFRNLFLHELTRFMGSDPELARVRAAQRKRLIDLPHISHRERLDEEWEKEFARAYHFSRTDVQQARKHAEEEEEQFDTVWDAIQGFTKYARGFQHQDARLDLERRAARLLEYAN